MATTAAAPSSSVVVGIDVGTGMIRLAQTTPARKMPVILRNSLANESTPTIVSYPDDNMRLFGEAAMGKELSKPAQTTIVLKQSLAIDGQTDAAEVANLLKTGTSLVRADDGTVAYDFNGVSYAPWQVLGFFLRQTAAFATEPVGHYCLAVPVAAKPILRSSMRDAAVVAGLDSEGRRVSLVNEPEALVAYMHHLQYSDIPAEPENAEKVIIINAGESYISVIAAEISKPRAIILAADGLAQGTLVVDMELASKAFASIQAKTKEDVSTHAKSFNKVVRECKKAKVMLTTTDRVTVQFECLKNDIDHQMAFTSDDLRAATEPLASAINQLVAKVMAAAGFTQGAVRVETVGNGWRSPALAAGIKSATGADRLGLSLDSNMCLAEGAAIVGVLRDVAAATAAAAAAQSETANAAADEAAAPAVAPAVGSPTIAPGGLVDPVHAFELLRRDPSSNTDDEQQAATGPSAAAVDVEMKLQANDDIFRQKEHAINEFETGLFKLREVPASAFGGDRAAYDQLQNHLSGEEDWMYDCCDGKVEGFTPGMMRERLVKLQADVEEQYPQVKKFRAEEAAKEKAKDEELAKLAQERAGEKELKSDPQRLRVAQERREQGATLFKQEHYAEAQTRFVQALGILNDIYDNTGDNKVKKEEIALSCHLNIASCCVKQSLWKIAVSNCTKALELKPDHPKALYRRGQAQAQLHEHDAAIADLEKALSLSNGDAAVQAELDAVRAKVAAAKAKEKKAFSKMFA